MTEEKKQAIIEAVHALKNGPFKATAIKVELEAHFNRDNSVANSESSECANCCGTGSIDCGCGDCDSEECAYCDGEGTVSSRNFRSDVFCNNWIMGKLAEIGLAERRENDHTPLPIYHVHHNNDDIQYVEKGPLVYGEFYNDRSVDSEFTFTIKLDNPENIFLVPRVVEIFASMGTVMGTERDVRGAGMHMALINHPQGLYNDDTRGNTDNTRRFNNFKSSMTMLLPALFFLGSNSDTSRNLRFRIPRVSSSDKYSSIYYHNGAVEFRVFETCYEDPESILDNFVVMKNCMRYWRLVRRPVKMGVRNLTFGTNDGADNKLERFYMTAEHLQVLNTGLKRLKPSYYTIKQLKRQRKFTVDNRSLAKMIEDQTSQATTKYKEYEERLALISVARRNRTLGNLIERQVELHDGRLSETDTVSLLQEAEREADRYMEAEKQQKVPMEQFIQTEIERFNQTRRGCYDLTV